MVELPTERNPALVLVGDCLTRLKELPDECVHCQVTSPPYFSLRDYGCEGQIGLENSPDEYVTKLVEVFREVRRVLRSDGLCFVNLGDSYANDSKWGGKTGGKTGGKHVSDLHGHTSIGRRRKATSLKQKELVGIPWQFAFAMRADGWYLRSAITLCKLSPMPESVEDRPTNATEMLFMFSKSPKYFYDKFADARIAASSTHQRLNQNVAKQKGSNRANGGAKTNGTMKAVGGVNGCNLWNYWPFRSSNSKESHFAAFNLDLPRRCLDLATSQKGVCHSCGAQWERIVEKERLPTRPGEKTKVEGKNSHFHISRDPSHPNELEGKQRADGLVVGNRDPKRHVTETKTVGWQPSCECNAGDPIGAIILDCFAGSGTSLVAAIEAGRRAIGCELNPEYVEIIHKRIREPLGIGGLFGPDAEVES